jgi:hypothetical protein
MAEERYDDLARDLTTLGGTVEVPASPERLAVAVLQRVASLPPPASERGLLGRGSQVARGLGRGWESRRRRVALAVAVVLLALLAAPPVRAAVLDWFGFGGVLVERGSPEHDGPAPAPPEVRGGMSVTEASAAVDFPVWVPGALGEPEGVGVAGDRRIVSMTWSDGPDGVVRLDQFDGRLDFTIAKTSPGVLYASVGGTDALWFEEPHEVVVIAEDGTRRSESARLAGHTLIWPAGPTTLRLEGDLTLDRAVEIAESAVPAD